MSDPQRDRTLALTSLVAVAVFAALPRGAELWQRVLPVIVALGLALTAMRVVARARIISLLSAALLGVWFCGVLWQAAMAIAIAACLLAKRLWSPSITVLPTRGTIPVLGTFVCGAVTPVALVSWAWLLKPDLSHITSAIPQAPLIGLILGGMAFAVINAVLEEWIWRGIVQPELTQILSSPAAVIVQALSFGSVHAHGFPSGGIGVTLAAAWALMLGILRSKSGGVLAPTLAHIVADASIAVIIIVRLPSNS